ncbi:hypothetical protein [Methanosarcina horonobensis]|uniref:hypothetical protein n=1 Tax=Methanosarcina horonobensis TaxID=418008 RepID=UPI000AD0C07C|nr:hypothetical protein [Methanosarcina horonobensis]
MKAVGKQKKELWETDLPFPELMKRAVSMKDDFIDQINLELLTDPEIKKLIDDFYERRYPYIVSQFIEKGRREGYIRRELSIEAAMLYLNMYQNAVQHPEMLKNRNKNLLKELYDLMLYGWRDSLSPIRRNKADSFLLRTSFHLPCLLIPSA